MPHRGTLLGPARHRQKKASVLDTCVHKQRSRTTRRTCTCKVSCAHGYERGSFCTKPNGVWRTCQARVEQYKYQPHVQHCSGVDTRRGFRAIRVKVTNCRAKYLAASEHEIRRKRLQLGKTSRRVADYSRSPTRRPMSCCELFFIGSTIPARSVHVRFVREDMSGTRKRQRCGGSSSCGRGEERLGRSCAGAGTVRRQKGDDCDVRLQIASWDARWCPGGEWCRADGGKGLWTATPKKGEDGKEEVF